MLTHIAALVPDNPLGEPGARAMFRSILDGLDCYISMQNCTFLQETAAFNHSNPALNSPYLLDLTSPYHCAVLAELSSLVASKKLCSFEGLTYKATPSSPDVTISSTADRGEVRFQCNSQPWPVPAAGTLRVCFELALSIPTADLCISEASFAVLTSIIMAAPTERDRENWLLILCMDAHFMTHQVSQLTT
jgi:hypothetical protein